MEKAKGEKEGKGREVQGKRDGAEPFWSVSSGAREGVFEDLRKRRDRALSEPGLSILWCVRRTRSDERQEARHHADAFFDGVETQEFAVAVEGAARRGAAVDDGNAFLGDVVAV